MVVEIGWDEMNYSNFKLKILVFFPLFTGLSLFSEPFLAPHDPFLRHEIRLLQDYGVLNSTLNSWPLNLGGMSYKKSNKLKHDILGRTIKKESQSGWSLVKTTVGFSDNRVTSRSFGNETRSRFKTGIERSWTNDSFVAKLSLNAFYGVKYDWKGRKDEGFALDGSYIAARLGNWSTSLGKVDRWWGPGWDGSLILSNNARPIPAISFDRRISEPFETKWLSWIGPWSFHSFIGRMEEERTIPNPYLWGIRVDFNPTLLDGLEIGLFRMMQLGGEGRPEGFSTWVDAFLSQDNVGANTGKDPAKEPGNQLAGLDIRWRFPDIPVALYGQVVGEDEDKFLPNSLMFQYGIETWMSLSSGTARFFVEYVDLTSYWWTDDPRTHNITYGHHMYNDGYRYHGRPVGHWADADSKIISLGVTIQSDAGIGWSSIIRTGDLNEDGVGDNSVSNGIATDYFSINFLNFRSYGNLQIQSELGWEKLNDGVTFSFSVSKNF